MLALEEAAKGEVNPAMLARNCALVRCENAIRIRRAELGALNIDDYQKPYITVRTLKGSRLVRRPLDPETCSALGAWIIIRKRERKQTDPDAVLTRGSHGPRLGLRGLNYILETIKKKAVIDKKKAGFHARWRARVADLHRRGVSGPALTEEWVWKSKETMNTYIRLTKSEVEEAIQEAHPYFQEQGSEDPEEGKLNSSVFG